MEKLEKLQKNFFVSLIEAKYEIGNEELQKRMKALQLDYLKPSFCVATVSFDFSQTDYEVYDFLLEEYRLYLIKLLKDYGYTGFAISNSYNNIWLLLTDINKEDIDTLFTKIHKALEKHFHKNVLIGVGSIVDSLNHANISATEAQEVLGFKFQYANDGIINIYDVVRFRFRSRSGSNIAYKTVIDNFLDGDLGKMSTNLDTLVEEIRYTPKVSKSSIRRVMIELTVQVLNIASNANIDVDKILDGKDPYTWIIRQGHTEVITAWFLQLCTDLLNEMNKQSENTESQVIRQACDYIEANIQDTTLGLQAVSDHAGLTSSYMSQLFKGEVGVGLNAYITQKRIDKAKDLLKNTNLKVDEVATLCGFASTSYFSQVFKKEVGSSANSYRNN